MSVAPRRQTAKNWDAGHEARRAGSAMDDNPHPFGCRDHREWRAGWLDLDQHLRDRDEALKSIAW